MIDKLFRTFALYTWHIFLFFNSLNTHRKEELQQQQAQLQLQLASSFAFYMRNNNKTRRVRVAKESGERESTRERNSLGEATVYYVMYFIVVFYRFSPLLSRRVRRCARGKS